MSEYRIKQDMTVFEIVDDYTKRIINAIDEQTLKNVENKLLEYGYVKVVRCKNCIYYEHDPNPIDPGWPMMCERTGDDMLEPYGFCAWGIPKDNNHA